jgi:hypothetical protein
MLPTAGWKRGISTGRNLGFEAAAPREAIRKVARLGGGISRSSGTAMNWIVDIRPWPFYSQQKPHLRGKFLVWLSRIVQVNSACIHARWQRAICSRHSRMIGTPGRIARRLCTKSKLARSLER